MDSVSKNNEIPVFYNGIPKEEDILHQKIREDARSNFLQKKNIRLLNNEELKELWSLLDGHKTCALDDRSLINYADFRKVGRLAGTKYERFFKASIFCKLQDGDLLGRVNVLYFFNYVMRKVWYEQTRIGLSLYDSVGHGYLRETELASYILDLIPTLQQLTGLEESFHDFYVCTAVRKFMFFLDPLHTGRVRILDILASDFLDELLELRDKSIARERHSTNWFSASSALRVYGDYLNLDKDHNGMLSKEELAGYGTGMLTDVFLDRIFQECLTYKGEMDYKTYLDLVLALENRQEPQSLRYLFRILDVRHLGYLDTFCLNYFFKAIQAMLNKHKQELVSFQDIQDEIFDMVKPENPGKITLNDLLKCGKGSTVISILVDLDGFWTHENRELMVSETVTDTTNIVNTQV